MMVELGVGMSEWRDTDVSSIAASVRNALVGVAHLVQTMSGEYGI